MPITDKLDRLGQAARRLNEGSDRINRLIARIDRALGELVLGVEYVFPRPLSEIVTVDSHGKRIIELSYLGYFVFEGGFHLGVRTIKVLESKRAIASEGPGTLLPLLQAPRGLRHLAVDYLPEMVSAVATEIDAMVTAMERRCATAEALLRHLESVSAGEARPAPARSSVTLTGSASALDGWGRPARHH